MSLSFTFKITRATVSQRQWKDMPHVHDDLMNCLERMYWEVDDKIRGVLCCKFGLSFDSWYVFPV